MLNASARPQLSWRRFRRRHIDICARVAVLLSPDARSQGGCPEDRGRIWDALSLNGTIHQRDSRHEAMRVFALG